ncbi:hypothetical protein N0V86_000533 [Didymella sp. IMI 355093]|nr:hypothetical protein N0V86_000533 [Didymella sp. IMI 355093]
MERSFSDTGIEIDTEEQPQSKRQRVHHDDPTANQTTPGEVSVFTKANGLEVVGGPPNEGTSDERDSDDTKPAADDTKASESVVEDSEGIHATKVTDDDAHIQTIMSKKADSFAIGEVSPNASAEGNIGISDSPSSRGNASEADSALPIVQLTGPYAESASAETQERITTASVSPTLSSVISPLAASTEHRCVRLTFKPLKPPKDPVELVKSEAADQVEDEDSAQEEYLVDAEVEYQEPEDVEESDELSEMDEEEMSRLSTAMETQEALDTTLPIKESTPAPETLASDEKEPNDSGTVTAMNDPASSQSENNATALILRHEVEFYYERRATRSETRTSDQGGAIISSLEGSTDTASAPAIKPEDDALLTKIIATREPGGRQTRSTTTSPSAPHHPAPASSADSTPNLPPADTRLSKPKTTPNPRCKTPRSHTTATETHKPTPKPDVTGADAKTTAPTDSSVLGKRKTRRSSALEEEVRKAAEAEGNIAKRLRSRDGV